MTWSYGNPAGAYLLLLIPLLIFIAWFGAMRNQRLLKNLGDPAVLRKQGSLFPGTALWRPAFLCLSLLWAILAWMDPLEELSSDEQKLLQPKIEQRRTDQEVWLLLDMSASMAVRDEEGGQSRLDVAKKTAEELLQLLPGRPVLLYTFTSKANLTVPLTWDQLFVILTLQHLSLDKTRPGGTNFISLFDTLKQALSEHRFSANSAFVLLTDGGDTAWETGGMEAKRAITLELQARLAQMQTPLFIVGMGSSQGGVVPNVLYEGKPVHSSLDIHFLESLSAPLGALFLSKDHSPYELARMLKEEIDRTLRYEKVSNLSTATLTKSRFIFPLTLAILFLLAALFLPGLPIKKAPL